MHIHRTMNKKFYVCFLVTIAVILLYFMPKLQMNPKLSDVLSTTSNSSSGISLFDVTVINPTVGEMKPVASHPVCTTFLTSPKRSGQECKMKTLKRTLPLLLKKQTGLQTALFGKSIAFVGDSRMRDMFWYLRSLLRGTPFRAKQFYKNAVYYDQQANTTLEFYWCRFPEEGGQVVAQWKSGFRIPPQYALMGFGAWSVMDNYGATSLDDFVGHVQQTSKLLHDIRNTTTAIWMQTIPANPTVEFDNWTQHNQNADHVETFGRRLATTAAKYGLIVWNTAHDIAKRRLDLFRDHVHPGTTLLRVFTCQLLHALEGNECR